MGNAKAAKIKAAAASKTRKANDMKAAAEGMIKKIENAACDKNPGCKGLEGYCCPPINTAAMKLGSTNLDGMNLACCGVSSELSDDREIEKSHNFGIASLVLAAGVGSAATSIVFKLFRAREMVSEPYHHLVSA